MPGTDSIVDFWDEPDYLRPEMGNPAYFSVHVSNTFVSPVCPVNIEIDGAGGQRVRLRMTEEQTIKVRDELLRAYPLVTS